MFVSRNVHNRKKAVAAMFLLVFACETFMPAISYALTSGPAQPEMKGFEPVGVSNMVDPFTGDFSYNIPLLDVDGYPVNLNYRAGSTPDDDASWVGYGWSVTPGALNRQLRGLPDDFNGSDQLVKETNYKEHVTKGLTTTVSLDLLGIPTRGGDISVGVEYDNYRGIGTKLGFNAGISLSDMSATTLNAGNGPAEADVAGGGPSGKAFSFGLTSSSMNGATASVNFPIIKKQTELGNTNLGLSIGFPYNSRAGLQGMSLSASFNPGISFSDHVRSGSMSNSSFISFAGSTYTPTIDVPATSSSFSVSLSTGLQIVPVYLGAGISGYHNRQFIADADKTRKLNGYGFLYADKGKDDNLALMDFNREKDIPYSKEVQYLPVPIPTNDLFMASSQGESGQYKIARGGHGVFFDPAVANKGKDASIGLELGFLANWDIGADLFFQNTSSTSAKWNRKNDFLNVGDFSKASTINSFKEKAYFKKTGEPVVLDNEYANRLGGDSTVAIQLNNASGSEIGTNAGFRTRTGKTPVNSALERTKRETRNQPFNYLTAGEASKHALEKMIRSYPENTIVLGNCSNGGVEQLSRTTGYRKQHHISEVTVSGNDGKRTVYGIPVYNTYQEETSFSVTGDTSNRSTGMIAYSGTPQSTALNSHSREKYYSKQTLPAYATSYLLTGILSGDYVDVTGNGITDDDMGNAVRFNYHKLPAEYQWRTPYAQSGAYANYSEGFLSDKLDDKANYTYGRKEVWYMHSIESKTMVALFITEDREDGLGVLSVSGGADTTHRLKKLKEIRLYSKSDIKANNNDLSKITPVKVVHFEYAYSLMEGMPNSLHNTGKLTLKKVYFTYGKSDIGIVHPYTFEYNADSIPITSFNHKQYDRWGTYKDKSANPGGLNNAEFPYTLQNPLQSNDFVSSWQLKKINLPTGGNISVTYEADDYAYVQNKRAMQMCKVAGIGTGGNSTANTGLIGAGEVFVDLPSAISNETDFIHRYLDGEQYLFFKLFTNLDNLGHYEFVPGYAKLKSVRKVTATRIAIALEPEDVEGVGPTNPMAHTAWQFIKSNLPKYAYPGYDNLDDEGSDLKKVIQSLGTTISNLKELIPNSFARIAKRRNYGNTIDLNKSFVRLQSPTFSKIGGGLRVKRIVISDAWQELSGVSNAKTATYTQEYNYTKTVKDYKGDDITISSGVASYEPVLGGEENPFHQPVFYRQNVILQLDSYYYIEEPFCEGLYPAPSVGYSRVAVKTIGSGEEQSRTGEVVNEFYTAKDYPTKVDVLSMEKTRYGSSKLLSIFTARMTESVGLSQGYRIENNDMHGKPKSVAVYNVSGVKISSTDYFYKTLNPNEENGKLDNRVKLLMPDTKVVDGIIGKDVETFSDMRESISLNEGTKLQGSFGSGGFWIFSFFFGFPGFGGNYDNRTYHSSSTIKIINNFAVLDKVRKMENGSSITTENVLWDGLTGDVVMTKTQNEYDDPVYNLSIPANWAYTAMGQSYQNDGTYLSNLITNANGTINNFAFYPFLHAGDEIANLANENRYWVIYTLGHFSLIDRNGSPLVNGNLGSAKIIRSGERNILSAPLCSYVSLKNPIKDNRISISEMTKVLAMEAAEYTDNWAVPKAVCAPSCPEGFTLSTDGLTCYKDTAVTTSGSNANCTTVCEGDHDGSYTSYGTIIHGTGYDINGNNNVDSTLVTGNSFWIGGGTCGTCGQAMNAKGGKALKATAEPVTQNAATKNTGMKNRGAALVIPQKTTVKASRPPLVNAGPAGSTKKMNSANTGTLDSLAALTAIKNAFKQTKTVSTNSKTSKPGSVGTQSAKTLYSSSGPGSNCTISPAARDTTHCGPLDRTGIWSCEGWYSTLRKPADQWIGFSHTINVTSSKTYYIGMAADNFLRFKIDGIVIMQKLQAVTENFKWWHIYPVYLTAGNHTIQMEAMNAGGPATMGAEIYDNTAAEIQSATGYCDLNLVFTTKNMIGGELNSGNPSCPEGYDLVSTPGGNICRATVPAPVLYNPYVWGHLGNWRPKTSYTFQTTRETVVSDPGVTGSTHTRYAGAYTEVVPFWQSITFNGQPMWAANGLSNNKWIRKNEATAFNQKGFSIEEKDPLNRYSSVLLGYLDSKPVAVASNTKYSELAFDGFEDYSFLLDCSSGSCNYNHFNIRQALSSGVAIDNAVAHSGNSSLRLTSTLNVTQAIDLAMTGTDQYTVNSTSGLYMINGGTKWSNGFTPVAGKKYVISLWLKDNAPRNPATATAVKINGTNIISSSLKWPVVEGWKRVEIPFIVPSTGFTLSIVPSGTVWVDDIRIAPFDGQVKSYAYDAVSQRLMAEMDENNFATFYEYDSEGTLVRVKKETEKGIVTIKETRSSYRRK